MAKHRAVSFTWIMSLHYWQQLYEVGTIISFFLQMKKTRDASKSKKEIKKEIGLEFESRPFWLKSHTVALT